MVLELEQRAVLLIKEDLSEGPQQAMGPEERAHIEGLFDSVFSLIK